MNNKAGLTTWGVRVSVFLFLAIALSLPSLVRAADTLCAKVQIEVPQEVTLERQAFDAHMRITNGLSHIALENVAITVNFTDEFGNPVLVTSDPNDTTASFFIRIDTMANISDVSGAGIVASTTTADINWLIIPAPGASNGVSSGTLYNVGK